MHITMVQPRSYRASSSKIGGKPCVSSESVGGERLTVGVCITMVPPGDCEASSSNMGGEPCVSSE